MTDPAGTGLLEAWSVERLPIQSRGGTSTMFRVGPMHALVYDDWHQREEGISEADVIAAVMLMRAAPLMLSALREIAKGNGFALYADGPELQIADMRAVAAAVVTFATRAVGSPALVPLEASSA